ncbi:hypothetical protein E0H57_33445 [Rhizobium leguminosarum bv. viciae]|nr:hypothetical protein E0H57_33445 [Rhizobium leguminosarum bv. viciae]
MHTIVRRSRASCKKTLRPFVPLDFRWTRMNLYPRSLQFGLRSNIWHIRSLPLHLATKPDEMLFLRSRSEGASLKL